MGTRLQEEERGGNVQESERDDWQGLAEDGDQNADGEHMGRYGEQYSLQDQDRKNEKAVEKEHEKNAGEDAAYQR